MELTKKYEVGLHHLVDGVKQEKFYLLPMNLHTKKNNVNFLTAPHPEKNITNFFLKDNFAGLILFSLFTPFTNIFDTSQTNFLGTLDFSSHSGSHTNTHAHLL